MKRSVIPVDFKSEVVLELKSMADDEGLSVAGLIRHLVYTHPKTKTYVKWLKQIRKELKNETPHQ